MGPSRSDGAPGRRPAHTPRIDLPNGTCSNPWMPPPLRWPKKPDEVSPDWLDSVLSLDRATPEPRVASVQWENIGDTGFIGELARLTIEYAGEDATKPRSLVAKFSNRDPHQRAMFHGIGLYAREVRFYRQLAAQAPIRTPHCYFAAIDPETGETALLLEDLAGLRTPDVVSGIGRAEAHSLVHALAATHARWWNRRDLLLEAEEASIAPILQSWHLIYQVGWPRFAERVRERLPEIALPPPFLELGDRLCRGTPDLLRPLFEPPVTWLHMDLHPDNLAFDTSGTPVVFDWQTSGLGRGPVDVGYFVASALPTELRRREEAALLDAYHADLEAGGVRDYSRDACQSDYARGGLWSLLVVAGLVSDSVVSAETLRYVSATLPRLISFLSDHEVDRHLHE